MGLKLVLEKRPVLLVIDINYNFLGDKPRPILESIEEWPNSCGEVGWKCIPKIINLITKCREKIFL